MRMTKLSVLAFILFCATLAGLPALAKDGKPAKHQEVALPDPLTKESIRELVSRLSDAEVRALLVKQLDRAAVPAPAKKATNVSLAQATGEEFAFLRTRAAEVLGSMRDFPGALAQVAERIAAPNEAFHLWKVAAGILGMIIAGAVAEFAFAYVTRRVRARFEERAADGLAATSVRFVLRAGIGVAHIAAFAAGAVALFVALWQGHEASRLLVLLTFEAILGVRVAALLARLLLEPKAPQLRMLTFDDRAAGVLYWGIVRLAIVFALIRVVQILLLRFEAPQTAAELWPLCAGTVAFLLVLDTVWRMREPVAALIRGSGEAGALRRLLADLWPGLATIYLFAAYFSRMHDLLRGDSETNNAPIISVLLLVALPIVDMFICRLAAELMKAGPQAGADAAPGGFAASFAPVLEKAIHIVVIVAGLLMLADLWELNLFAMAEQNLGGRITSAFLGIALTALIAWMLWEVALTAIDRRMGAETVAQGHKISRLRTLLPLLRATLQVTIIVIAVLSILAALGVNILPLLAGASVVGVAIGFGSQTLVRDIVSGAFFLMDDAFRLGEYIEVGDAKGTVEKIGVRAVILRHHRGALNVLPYGEIKRLRNTSRDWMIMKMEFRLTYDTDLKKVKQIVKKIGKEISEDPELGKHLIEPLKSQGVTAAEDSALIVRVKYMADPASGGAFTIRREAYAKIIAAFSEAGIKFANRQVTVNVPAGLDPAVAAAAATAADQGKK
jgi:small-conductance mechanosensitive channel